jgi:hypothetical protein
MKSKGKTFKINSQTPPTHVMNLQSFLTRRDIESSEKDPLPLKHSISLLSSLICIKMGIAFFEIKKFFSIKAFNVQKS